MYIDPSIVSAVVENGKKNILILGLSTFSIQKQNIDGTIRDVLMKSKMSTEKPTGVTLEQEYFYQLEPVPLMLFNKLGKKIDLVIEIGTTLTEKKREVYLQTGVLINKSPREFFEEQLSDKVVAFRSFTIDDGAEDVMPERIIEIVRLLQEIKEKDEYDLWIDNHGGLRNSQMVLQCILSLLKKDGIQPKETYMLEYSNGVGVVKVAKQANSINEFVSGVNEFLNFGRTQSIQKYFELNHEKSDLPEKIQNIADAIQLCNVEEFEKALNAMQKWISDNYQAYENRYQELFVEYLRADYGDLLDDTKRTILKEIEWCVKKDFIQQALTLIESKMPGVITDKKYGYLAYNENAKVNIPDEGEITVSEAINRGKKEWEQSDNYILQQFCFANVLSRDNATKKYIYQDLEEIELLYVNISQKRPVRIYEGKKLLTRINIHLPSDSSKLENLYKFLAIHMALKNQRNLINHANGTDNKRVSVQTLKNAIQTYIKLAKKLGIE